MLRCVGQRVATLLAALEGSDAHPAAPHTLLAVAAVAFTVVSGERGCWLRNYLGEGVCLLGPVAEDMGVVVFIGLNKLTYSILYMDNNASDSESELILSKTESFISVHS